MVRVCVRVFLPIFVYLYRDITLSWVSCAFSNITSMNAVPLNRKRENEIYILRARVQACIQQSHVHYRHERAYNDERVHTGLKHKIHKFIYLFSLVLNRIR